MNNLRECTPSLIIFKFPNISNFMFGKQNISVGHTRLVGWHFLTLDLDISKDKLKA